MRLFAEKQHWGAAYTSQKLIDSVKAAGFNTVRLPVAWFCHSDTVTSAIDQGIPVIIGEYGAFRRKLSPPADQVLHNASIEYYYRYFTKSAMSKGMITFMWDTPGGMINRSNGAINDRVILNAIMHGAKDVTMIINE